MGDDARRSSLKTLLAGVACGEVVGLLSGLIAGNPGLATLRPGLSPAGRWPTAGR